MDITDSSGGWNLIYFIPFISESRRARSYWSTKFDDHCCSELVSAKPQIKGPGKQRETLGRMRRH